MATLLTMIRVDSRAPVTRTVRVAATALLLPLLVGLSFSCRDSATSVAGSTTLPIVPSTDGVSGCAGVNQVFMPGQLPTAVALGTLTVGPSSQIVAARGAEVLYATGAGATLVELDFSGGLMPVETELISAGTIAALYAGPGIGIADAPEISGVAVLDANSLIVMEHTANVLLLVDRVTPDTVSLYAGTPSTVPGFADGFALQIGMDPIPLARFSFSQPAQLAPTGEMPVRIFINDVGNHALRILSGGMVTTIAGSGTPLFGEGPLAETFFDTPSGLSIGCNNALVITEGNGFVAGNRVRRLTVGGFSPLDGSQIGFSETIAGDGAALSTDGMGTIASVGSPVSPVTTTEGDTYWVDATTGVLRRLANEIVDCPLHMDCATATGAPNFSVGVFTSLAQTEGGVLYALDGTAGTLFRITP